MVEDRGLGWRIGDWIVLYVNTFFLTPHLQIIRVLN